MNIRLKLKDVKPNPSRDLKGNPLDETKLSELVDSINDTGFWDNVVVRKNTKGEYELAYGHHRVEAAKRAGKTEVDFIVKDFDDELMIKVLGRENSEAYAYSVLSLLEKVRAVVSGLADGRVKPFKIDPKTNAQYLMNAPSYTPGVSVRESLTHPYTAGSVADFLGRTMGDGKANDSVQAALGALHLIELGVIQESSIKNMTVDKLLGFVRDLKKKQAVYEEQRQKAQLDAKALQERQAKLDTDRREQEAKDKETERKRLQALAEAKLENDKVEMARIEEGRKRDRERAEARALVQKENRAKLDEAIDAANARAEAFKPKPEETLRAQAVGAMKFKFDSIYSDASGLLKESEILGRNQKLTPNEREILRQSMLKAGERLRYGAENFLPVGTPRMATKALREKEAKENAKKFFKKPETKSKGEK